MGERLDHLAFLLNSGFYDADEAMEHLEEAFEDTPPAVLDQLRVRARQLVLARRAEEATWTTPTTNDLLAVAFEDLRERHIIALHNAGFTQSDGWDDAREQATARSRGVCFYHGQDVERAVEGGGLHLAFGSLRKEVADAAIGHEIVEVLRAGGLEPRWSGQETTRIYLPPFVWQQRRFTRRPGVDVLVIACLMEHRVAVIKACRELLGLDMRTTRAALDRLTPPDILGYHNGPPWRAGRGLPREEATRVARALEAAGAKVTVR